MSKYILAIDTAGNALSIGLARYTGRPLNALHEGARVGLEPAGDAMRHVAPYEMIADTAILAPRQANSLLLPRIDEMLYDLDVNLGDIASVVVGRGPGSFTGVRIGVATAKGLARGLGAPLYGVSTTDAVAQALAATGFEGWALIALDAMRKEIYPALVCIERGVVTRWRPDYVGKPQDVMEPLIAELLNHGFSITKDKLRVLGSGLLKHRTAIEEALTNAQVACDFDEENDNHVTGEGLVRAYIEAVTQAPEAHTGSVADVLPIYTRLSDAEEAERERGEHHAATVTVEAASAVAGTPVLEVGEGKRSDGDQAPVTLRLLNPSDLDAMAALEGKLEHSSYNYGLLAREFDVISDVWIGAFISGDLVGHIGLANLGGDVHVLNIAVDPTQRRQGIARQLMEAAFDRVLMWRARAITLEVRVSNEPATRLYESLGFHEEGIRPRYYRDGEDARIMWAELVDEPTAQMWWGAQEREAREETGKRILALESSCDETAAAIVEGNTILSNVVASQIDFHARFGGVVPEIASRKHIEAVVGVIDEALDQAHMPLSAMDALAVTVRPGLIGALVVGLAFMKGLSYGSALELFGVNHLEGHIYANVLAHPEIEWPLVALVVSGGHTSLIYSPREGEYETLGETLDDAAGEAFDKVAKAMGLPYPGGPVISRLAEQGDPKAIDFPRAMMHSHDYRFSLSGLKTAVITYIRQQEEQGKELNKADIAASFQQAVVDVQVAKAVAAAQEKHAKSFLLAGGVSANPVLRAGLIDAFAGSAVFVSVPPLAYCTDNAAMIGRAAVEGVKTAQPLGLDAEAAAHAPLDEEGHSAGDTSSESSPA